MRANNLIRTNMNKNLVTASDKLIETLIAVLYKAKQYLDTIKIESIKDTIDLLDLIVLVPEAISSLDKLDKLK